MAVAAKSKVTVLGINGHIGHHAAVAFVAAGWEVTGFGRSNKHPIPGMKFITGDADSVAEMRAAIRDTEVVVNALNLPYDKWFGGALEAQTARVIEAMGKTGKTMLYPGNIYNFAASLRDVTPDAPQHPETPRGAVRVRIETLLRQASARGDLQAIIIRAGDFYAPNNTGDWFDQGIFREKGKIAAPGDLSIGHSWAYLPDLGEAFEKLAWHRKELAAFENFHFAGHFVTSGELLAAVQQAAPVKLKVTAFPWTLLKLIGLFSPIMREVVKMRYLWQNAMRLSDERLDALLGPDFGTPYQEAINAVVAPFFAGDRKAA